MNDQRDDLFDQPSTRAAALVSRPQRQKRETGVHEGFVLSGRWTWSVGQRLGTGGYGAVYHATRIGADPEVAIPTTAAVKVFRAPEGLDPESLLKRELAALLALRSERIPRVFDWSVADGRCFVVMQLFPRGSLVDTVDDRTRLKPAAAWRLLLDLLQALIEAHHASLLHLDVKPSNVLIDGQGGFVLTDFGVAQSLFATRTTGVSGQGTMGYRAPEQTWGNPDDIDVRTDLFGVGATVWSRLAGVELTRHPELLTLERGAHQRYALPPPSAYNRHVPQALDTAVMNLLTIDPVDRPGGAAEALTMTRRLLSGHSSGASLATDKRGRVEPHVAAKVTRELIDPLWVAIAGGESAWQFLVHYRPGERLCREGERSHHAFALLKGEVAIERGAKRLFVESREGTFLGEVSTLTGDVRTASMRALTHVWVLMFNAAELEQFVTANPALGIRMIKTLAERLARESAR